MRGDTLDSLREARRHVAALRPDPPSREQIARSTFGVDVGPANIVPHFAPALIRAQQIAAAMRRGRAADT